MSQVPPYRLPSAPAQNSQEHVSASCPGCGAGYKVGLSACEYCRRPVRHTPTQQYRAVVFDEMGNATLRPRKLVEDDMLAIVHPGETIIPKAWA